jgi:hypothetical protein
MKVVIVPCSGIGKSYGTVSREGAYIVSEDLRPETTQLVPLSLLVLGDEQARADVSGTPAITIDGCKLACATKMVAAIAAEAGGTVAHDPSVSLTCACAPGAGRASLAVLDVYRRHRDLKPAGIAELNEGGQKLAQALAEEVATLVDDILVTEIHGDASHRDALRRENPRISPCPSVRFASVGLCVEGDDQDA